MGNFNKLPKLMYKKNYPDFSKRGNKNKPTSKDVEDWVEALQWLSDVLLSKEFQDPQNNQRIGEIEKDEKGKNSI